MSRKSEEKRSAGDKKGIFNFQNLLSPVKIGDVELKNRIAVAPMQDYMTGPNGEITEQGLSYIAARAKGGAGLVISGVILGTRLASQFPMTRSMVLYHQGHQLGFCRYAERIHYFGAKACAQLSPGLGRQSTPYDPEARAPAPTGDLPYEIATEKMARGIAECVSFDLRARMALTGPLTREMTIADIQHEQKEFANSCQLAVMSGFDMIEIHATHGFLCHQFLSPLSNKRTDMYGGEWRNRKRFLSELMEAVRYACQGVPVGVRISAEEHMEGGLTRDEMIDVSKDLEARGADYIHLSDGAGFEENGHQIPDADRAEHMPGHGADFKKSISIPVMVISQHDPVAADDDIGKGRYDISALGRQLLCDPDYPRKLIENREDEIVRCLRCNTCMLRGMAGMYLACPLNPHLGREYLMDEYRMGPWKEGESIIPENFLTARMPALYKKSWWLDEIKVVDRCWRPFRGPGPR
ncbi:MAG TPA: NADH:flavin oxidoreductase [Deltaproteobacteria bacterium]|nr:NADH:flavin oxidoreductase [Deltaproteobacteria bacterium]